ncbi:enoyl-CoA hydratase/isomerase family protein [Streptomyces mirabilis]|uniref:enoyl-CoA hydratase/isomerase family protein n=1 Tax=Streptomyces mirabilis TaxID=68239 RepID=UPI00366435BF
MVTLDREKRRNAIDDDMRNALLALLRAEPDPASRVLVLRARGPVFSAGNDMKMIEARKAAGGARAMGQLQLESLQLLQAFATCPVPTLAVVDGPVYGFAADLITHCDWVIGSERATFHWPEWKFGIMPTGSSLERCGPEFLWRGLSAGFTAEEALSSGLLRQLEKSEDLDAGLRAHTGWVAELSPGMYEAWRAAVLSVRRPPPDLWSRLPGLWAPEEDRP